MLHTLEDKLLFVGGKPYLTANEIEFLRITLTENRVNWEEILAKAYYHQCLPMLYWNLKGMHDDFVPVLTELKETYVHAYFRNWHCINQVEEMLRGFMKNCIQAILLKGVALTQAVYPNIALRTCTDVDLLIRPNDLPRVKDTLIQLGYQVEPNFDQFNVSDVKQNSFYIRHIKFERRNSSILSSPIDLHCHLGWDEKRETAFWERSQAVNIGSVKSLVLCPEDCLTYLCIHLHHHGYDRLKWFVDINALVATYQSRLDWNLLIAEYKGTGIGTIFYHTLRFVQQVLHCKIPEDFLSDLQPHRYESRLFGLLWNEHQILKPVKGNQVPQLIISALFTIDRPALKAKLITRTLFPKPKFIRSRYADNPRHVVFLYLKYFVDAFRYFVVANLRYFIDIFHNKS